MEQVQMTMLNMMQAMTIPQSSKNAESVKPESDFRSMMEKQSKQQRRIKSSNRKSRSFSSRRL